MSKQFKLFITLYIVSVASIVAVFGFMFYLNAFLGEEGDLVQFGIRFEKLSSDIEFILRIIIPFMLVIRIIDHLNVIFNLPFKKYDGRVYTKKCKRINIMGIFSLPFCVLYILQCFMYGTYVIEIVLSVIFFISSLWVDLIALTIKT